MLVPAFSFRESVGTRGLLYYNNMAESGLRKARTASSSNLDTRTKSRNEQMLVPAFSFRESVGTRGLLYYNNMAESSLRKARCLRSNLDTRTKKPEITLVISGF